MPMTQYTRSNHSPFLKEFTQNQPCFTPFPSFSTLSTTSAQHTFSLVPTYLQSYTLLHKGPLRVARRGSGPRPLGSSGWLARTDGPQTPVAVLGYGRYHHHQGRVRIVGKSIIFQNLLSGSNHVQKVILQDHWSSGKLKNGFIGFNGFKNGFNGNIQNTFISKNSIYSALRKSKQQGQCSGENNTRLDMRGNGQRPTPSILLDSCFELNWLSSAVGNRCSRSKPVVVRYSLQHVTHDWFFSLTPN